MARRPLLALLVVLAGCAGGPGGAQHSPSTRAPTATETATATAAVTPTPGGSTTPTATTPAATTTATGRTTVDYTALSASQQRAFDRALEGTPQFLDQSTLESPYVGEEYFPRRAAEPFEEHGYIRRNGTLYRLSFERGGGDWFATYGIEAMREQPPADARVVALENLSTRVREPVRQAVDNGSSGAPAGQWDSLPNGFDRFEYVRASGTTYRITVVSGDLWADTLHAERVENGSVSTTQSGRDARN
jgi:hypothetical protein